MHLRDMKYIGFKHRRENKQNSDKGKSRLILGILLRHLTSGLKLEFKAS